MFFLHLLRRTASILLAFVLLAIAPHDAGTVRSAEPAAANGDAKQRPTNRLSRETSPYLLLHAHNPVDWYPWGPEAFEKARRDNKPIFLSVGYSSCYWCHVMERESFSDEAIAGYMNEHFVNVKVDREERPDVDDIYMTALQIYLQLSGAGGGAGWPLSMFLTPEGKPIAGGTYFPPEDIDGRVGFSTVMKRIDQVWQDQREDVQNNAELITLNLKRVMKPRLNLQPAELKPQLVATVAQALIDSADPQYGGVDFHPDQPDAPKFPVPAKLALLQHRAEQGDAQAARVVEMALDRLARGGIRDHLGGGFHRYSTDRQWLVPHFEKMLYDNAQLADVYVTAWLQTKKPQYRQAAEETFAFVLRDMTNAGGAFYSALDAETDSVEGKYYVWTKGEIEQILGKPDAALFQAVYGMNEPSEFEHGYVLHLPQPMSAASVKLEIAEEELQSRLGSMREKLLSVRRERPAPLRDDKVLTSWNGLMIRALANGGGAFDRPEYVAAAARGARFLLDNLRDEQGRLLRTYREKTAKLNGYLDDYAFLVEGLLALYRASGDEQWLSAAKDLTDQQLALFRDEKGGGFYFTSHHHEELLARTMNAYDAVLPSGNSVSARNLLRLGELTGDTNYGDRSREILELFAPQLESQPRSMTNMALALAEFLEMQKAGASGEQSSNDDAQGDAKKKKTEEEEKFVPFARTPLPRKEDDPKKEEYVAAGAYLSVDRLPAGNTCRLALVLDVKEGWHVNANPPKPEFLIPTSLSIKSAQEIKLTRLQYPKGEKLAVLGFDEPLQVYEKRVMIVGTLEIPASAAGQVDEMELRIRYQACNESRCLAPKNITLTAKVPVAAAGQPVQQINGKLFEPKKEDDL